MTVKVIVVCEWMKPSLSIDTSRAGAGAHQIGGSRAIAEAEKRDRALQEREQREMVKRVQLQEGPKMQKQQLQLQLQKQKQSRRLYNDSIKDGQQDDDDDDDVDNEITMLDHQDDSTANSGDGGGAAAQSGHANGDQVDDTARQQDMNEQDDIGILDNDDNDDDYDVVQQEHEDNDDERDNDQDQDDNDDDDDELSSSPSIPDEHIDFDLVYALHTFLATVEGQASVVKGDQLTLLDDTNSYWWLVRVLKTQAVGYIPAENIETPFERLARLNKHRNVGVSPLERPKVARQHSRPEGRERV